jgi:hypothetical protein
MVILLLQDELPCKGCGGTCSIFYSDEGQITDGSGMWDYDNNADCKWVIANVGGDNVTLSFSELETERFFDVLWVYTCPDEDCLSTKVLGLYSGWLQPFELATKDMYVIVHFRSDEHITYDGFTMRWTRKSMAQPGGAAAAGGAGTVAILLFFICLCCCCRVCIKRARANQISAYEAPVEQRSQASRKKTEEQKDAPGGPLQVTVVECHVSIDQPSAFLL